MANVVYNSAKVKLNDGSIVWGTTAIKVALVTSAYTPDIDAHTNYTDITNEITDTGYTAGGAVLTAITPAVDNTNDLGIYDAEDVTWTPVSFTARAAIVYASVSGDLICYCDFGVDKISTDGDFTLIWHANGVFSLA